MAVALGLMLQIFETVIIPVFIVIAVGFAIRRLTAIESRSLSNLILYAFTPCLVFTGIANSSLESQSWGQIAIITVGNSLVMMVVAWSVAKTLNLSQKLTSALILSIALTNSGNYGLPINLLAFGQKGFEIAVVFYVVSTVISYTLGAFIASRGTQGLKQSLISIFRLPLIYAVIAALAVRFFVIQVPKPLLQSVSIMSGAAIPGMLMVLGLELAEPEFLGSKSVHWKLAGLSSCIKLLFPIIPVLVLTQVLGVEGLVKNVLMIQACMPTAVFAVIFAIKYKGASQFVSSVQIVSTLLSLLTLTILLSFMI